MCFSEGHPDIEYPLKITQSFLQVNKDHYRNTQVVCLTLGMTKNYSYPSPLTEGSDSLRLLHNN